MSVAPAVTRPVAHDAASSGRLAAFIHALRTQRRGLLWWTVGITLAATVYAGFYPQMAESGTAQAEALPESLRDAFNMTDIASAAGYLGSTVFGLIVPLVAMFFGAVLGTRVSAADEESGTLDLVLAHPITRTSLVLQRFAALVVSSSVMALGVWLAMLAIRDAASLTAVGVGELGAQCLHLALLMVMFGALATSVGGATGRRGVVLAVTAVVGVASYAAHAFGPVIGADALSGLSPFHYYIGSEPLRNGVDWGGIGVLAAASAVLVALGTWLLSRRDLG